MRQFTFFIIGLQSPYVFALQPRSVQTRHISRAKQPPGVDWTAQVYTIKQKKSKEKIGCCLLERGEKVRPCPSSLGSLTLSEIPLSSPSYIFSSLVEAVKWHRSIEVNIIFSARSSKIRFPKITPWVYTSRSPLLQIQNCVCVWL